MTFKENFIKTLIKFLKTITQDYFYVCCCEIMITLKFTLNFQRCPNQQMKF